MEAVFLVGIRVSLPSREPAAEARFEDETLRAHIGIGVH